MSLIAIKKKGIVYVGTDDRVDSAQTNGGRYVPSFTGLVLAPNGVIICTDLVDASCCLISASVGIFKDMGTKLTREFLACEWIPKFREMMTEWDFMQEEEDFPDTGIGIVIAWRDKLFYVDKNFRLWEMDEYCVSGYGWEGLLPTLYEMGKNDDPVEVMTKGFDRLGNLIISEPSKQGYAFANTKDLQVIRRKK